MRKLSTNFAINAIENNVVASAALHKIHIPNISHALICVSELK